MRAKFSSRSGPGATSTPIFLASFVTNCLLFCIFCHSSDFVYGQRIFWMYSPLPQMSNHYRGFYHHPPQRIINSDEVTQYNGVSSSDNSANTKSVMMLLPLFHDHSHTETVSQQRSKYAPLITPIIIRQYGSASWQEQQATPQLPSPYYYSSSKIRGKNQFGFGGDDETVLLNQNILEMGKNNDESSNGSGSPEVTFDATELQQSTEGLSVMNHQLYPMKYNLMHGGSGAELDPVAMLSSSSQEEATKATAVIVDNRVITSRRCTLEGDQARYDPVTSACYTVGTKGPCGNYMIFTAVPGDNSNGVCDCDYDSFDRPLALVGGQCHFLYTQAICYPGYWLAQVTTDYEPVCQQNPCYHPHMSSKNSIILFKGECVNLNSSSRHCRRDGEVVLFPKGSIETACGFPKSTKRIYRRQISNVNRFACGPGMRRHKITKKCIRSRHIVFARGGM